MGGPPRDNWLKQPSHSSNNSSCCNINPFGHNVRRPNLHASLVRRWLRINLAFACNLMPSSCCCETCGDSELTRPKAERCCRLRTPTGGHVIVLFLTLSWLTHLAR